MCEVELRERWVKEQELKLPYSFTQQWLHLSHGYIRVIKVLGP